MIDDGPYRSAPKETTVNTADKIRDLRADLTARYPERSRVIDGCIASVLSGEHVLLLGPPGTAKSSLARAVASAFECSYFERLLTKFSTPDELFGPVSLRALEQDRFERVTAGKLPEAEIGFVDEVFRANSAILNNLLTLMNERLFHNDGKPVTCPLVTLFGASNDLPEGRELEGGVRPLPPSLRRALPRAARLPARVLAPDPVSTVRVTMLELRAAQAEAATVTVTDETVDGLLAIRESLQAEGIIASDRRWKKSLKLVRASAYALGESKTCLEDLAILTDSLWREPKERDKVERVVGAKADPVGAQAREVLESARETARGLVALKAGEKSLYVGAAHQRGRPLRGAEEPARGSGAHCW